MALPITLANKYIIMGSWGNWSKLIHLGMYMVNLGLDRLSKCIQEDKFGGYEMFESEDNSKDGIIPLILPYWADGRTTDQIR